MNEFCFDYWYDKYSKNSEIYQNWVSLLVWDFLNGKNSAIYTYGQENKVKYDTFFRDLEQEGLIEQAIEQILEGIKGQKWFLKASFLMKIAGEVFDLFLDKEEWKNKDMKEEDAEFKISHNVKSNS